MCGGVNQYTCNEDFCWWPCMFIQFLPWPFILTYTLLSVVQAQLLVVLYWEPDQRTKAFWKSFLILLFSLIMFYIQINFTFYRVHSMAPPFHFTQLRECVLHPNLKHLRLREEGTGTVTECSLSHLPSFSFPHVSVLAWVSTPSGQVGPH